jgi:ATP-binding cassette subfamily B protein
LGLFLIAVLLLIARAALELSLPALMSDIVDVGISQRGIDRVSDWDFSPQTWEKIRDIKPIVYGGDLEPYIANALAELYYGSADFDPRLTYQLAIEFIHENYPEDIVNANQMNYVYRTGGIMLLLTFISIATAIAQGFMSARIATGMARKLRQSIFSKVTGFNNAEYNLFSTASLITRCTNDVNQVQQLLAIAVRIVVYSPIMALGGILMVLGTDPSMAWVLALAIGAIVTLIAVFIIIAMPKFTIMQKLIDKVNLVTREGLTGIMVIRAFNTQKHEENRFDEANAKLQKTALFLARMGAFQNPAISLIMGATYIMIIWFGGASVGQGNLQVGDMMAFITYTMFVIWSFMMLAMIIVMLPRAQVSASRIMEVMDTSSTVLEPLNPAALPKDKGFIEFKNVSFEFPGAVDSALSNVSFFAESGKMTAIVGSTGSGKTALANLIPRFYDVSGGQVLVNGADVRSVSLKDLRDLIGYVPQKALLFSGTIESNIKYAGSALDSACIDDEDMQKAARISQSLEFIEEKPGGYAEEITQGGTNVSGGQRQRLAIARAIAKNPKIYIFDDSFSALDYKTDALLRLAIKKEIGEATMIVVAQRINTIKSADQIIVLDEGKVVGIGKHRELLNDCDVYRQIAGSQLSAEELERDLAGANFVRSSVNGGDVGTRLAAKPLLARPPVNGNTATDNNKKGGPLNE